MARPIVFCAKWCRTSRTRSAQMSINWLGKTCPTSRIGKNQACPTSMDWLSHFGENRMCNWHWEFVKFYEVNNDYNHNGNDNTDNRSENQEDIVTASATAVKKMTSTNSSTIKVLITLAIRAFITVTTTTVAPMTTTVTSTTTSVMSRLTSAEIRR